MEASLLLLSEESRTYLRKGGFVSLSQVLKLSPTELAKELKIDLKIALLLLQEIKSIRNPQQPTVIDMLTESHKKSTTIRNISTWCRDLDQILDGGFVRGKVTEICGTPGSGKTQLCMQIAVGASVPECFHGVEGEALYLDTEGSFSPKRAMDMAEAVSSHLSTLVSRGGVMMDTNRSVPTPEDILRNIHVCRAHDRGEQLAFVRCLRDYLQENSRIKVVIIDSVAHHFRHDFSDMSMRGKLLARHAADLNKIAQQFDVVVLVTNHMTTKPDGGFVPALGEQWFHGITNRIIVTKTGESVEWLHPKKKGTSEPTIIVPVRKAEIVKSSDLKAESADFLVVSIGIRVVPRSSRQQPRTEHDSKRTKSETEV
jgi:RAD51-like protein 2